MAKSLLPTHCVPWMSLLSSQTHNLWEGSTESQKVNLQHPLGNGETEGKEARWEKYFSSAGTGDRALTSDSAVGVEKGEEAGLCGGRIDQTRPMAGCENQYTEGMKDSKTVKPEL